MQINVTVLLAEDDPTPDADELAAAVLSAAGGNDETDLCTVHVALPPATGTAGTAITPQEWEATQPEPESS